MKIYYILLLFCFGFGTGYCQMPEPDSLNTVSEQAYSGVVSLQGIATTDGQVPFWMHANQYGSIPLKGVSSSLLARYSRDYVSSRSVVDWGFGVEGRLNIGKQSSFQLIQGFVKGKLSIFQLKVGRSKDMIGLVDSSLSTGSFALAGNALGIPKVELSVPDYWALPLTNGILSFKGNFVHGWMGNTRLLTRASKVASVNSYFHQKSLYGRLGKDTWKVRLYAGFNHQVMWGGERQISGKAYKLSDVQTFFYVLTGKAYGASRVPTSKIGNHIGSLDQAIEVDFKKIKVLAYHQFLYDVGGLYHLNNVKDGLWGLSLSNKQLGEGISSLGWRKLLIEIWNSTSQGGEADAKITPSGDENYYNNYIYADGWSYKGENLGNPLFTNRKYARTDLPARRTEYIINNRLVAFHFGLEGFIGEWNGKALLTFSRNIGTWGTSSIGGSLGPYRTLGPPPYFEEVFQFSGYLEASRPIGNGFSLGFALAVDQGKLLYNSVGGLVKLSRNL